MRNNKIEKVTDKTPCRNCLCRGICRYKSFEDLVNKCSLVRSYIWIGEDYYIDRFIKGEISYIYTTIKEVETKLVAVKLSLNSSTFKIYYIDMNSKMPNRKRII